jgi:hypothetical protein
MHYPTWNRPAYLLIVAFLFAVSPFVSATAHADSRTEYLIKMLETGNTYLVKVQAAGSLGKIRATTAVPALIRALDDKEELVVIAAATALGQIGDAAAIDALQKLSQTARSTAVKKQARTSLQVLQNAPVPSGVATPDVSATQAIYLAKIDAMGNTSTLSDAEAAHLMKSVVTEALTALPEVQLQAAGLSETQVRQKLSAEKLQGFIISGALVGLVWHSNAVEVSVSLNVFSNPDYSLLMMPSGSVKVPVSAAATAQPAAKSAEQSKAVRRLVDDMLRQVMEALPSVL